MAAIHLLRRSIAAEDGFRRASFDAAELSVSSDTESASSGSNSGSLEAPVPPGRGTPGGTTVPARFLQQTPLPVPSRISRAAPSPKTVPAKKSLLNGFSCSSPSPASLTKNVPPPLKRTASPSRARNGSAAERISNGGQCPKSSSVIGFGVEARRRKSGDIKVEEAHLLRVLYNRLLQWWCVNARAGAAFLAQKAAAEKDLYDAWCATSNIRDSVMRRKLGFQLLTQKSKLFFILKGQMAYLEEWSLVDIDHLSSLSGAIEALKTSTLRIPVTDGAKAEIQEVKNAVGSAVDVMQTIGSSTCSLLWKVVAETSSLVSELSKIAAEERALMEQSRELLSAAAAMHVKHYSLLGQLIQLTRRESQRHL
uniref:QWRF motif-containing protein 2-like n=1 Tax=Ananas comosus var. bracteatus TaxID=296719 RepID=A0A6V7NLL6_ANACO|nr:unnamed protein product [Ananas comosus var. bracteatus]